MSGSYNMAVLGEYDVKVDNSNDATGRGHVDSGRLLCITSLLDGSQ